MRSKTFNKIVLIVFLSISSFSFSQQTVNHHVPFASGNQNMWGPSWSAFNMNQTIPLFDESWNLPFSWSSITTILGADFGAGFTGGFSGNIGSSFSLTGFTTGEVAVDYPIDVVLTMPTDNLYDQGDNVTIQTEYTIDESTAELVTMYPNAGEASLDLYFQMAASLTGTICVFGCTNFPIIPAFDTGLNNINILTVNENEASFFSFNNGAPAFGPYPILPLSTSQIPDDPLGEFGLEGIIDVPYVYTSSSIDNTNLELGACGGGEHADSAYLKISLDIFALLGNIPGTVGEVLGNLSGSEGFGGAEVWWNLFSTSFNFDIHNKQCFNFDPKVFGKFEFPVAVDYTIYNGLTAVSSGTSSIVNVEIGQDIDYKFPCYFEEMDIAATYSIDGVFSNYTYDSAAIYVEMSAFQFGFTIPEIEITPQINIPEICIQIPYPCPTWSCPWCWCSYEACTPAFSIPAVVFPAMEFTFPDPDPLWSTTIAIADFQYPWYQNTWSLEGFSEHTMPVFTMKANPITLASAPTDVDCYGGSNGAVNTTINALSHANPYTYVWSNGATTQDLTNVPAGPYECVIYDAHDCPLFTGATVDEPSELEVSYVKIDNACGGVANIASIDATVTGGTTPYTYIWSNGALTEDLNSLAGGTYTLTVTDFKGCAVGFTVDIITPTTLGHNATVTDVNCNGGSDGAVDVTTYGGTLPYSFSWSSGEVSEDINAVVADSYTITITDGNGCINAGTHDVIEPVTSVNLTSTAIDVSCRGGNDGSIDVTTTGGTPGYTYQWISDQGGVLPYTTEDISTIPYGTYTVTATDINGCQFTSSQLVDEPIANLSSTPVLVDILCFGDATGSIDPVIAGGTLAYSYSWSNGATTPTISALIAGSYALTVTDSKGCVGVYNYTLTESAQGLSLTLAGTDILCNGDATGVVETTVDGGTPNYTYLWSNGGTTADISNLLEGNYSVVVTDDHGCTVTDNLTLVEPTAPLAVTTVITDVDCYGNNSGTVDLTVTGGTSPYIQLWSNLGTIVLSDTTEDLSNLIADTYTVLVTDANGCAEMMNSIVNEPNAPLAITGIVDDANCFGLNDGAIDITVTGGTTLYNYSWSSGQLTEDISIVVAGSYAVTVTDQNLCVETMSFVIDQPLAPLNVVTFTTDVLCNGYNDGAIESDVSGGTMPYIYAWSNAETTDDIGSLLAGVYTLTVTDDQGCTSFTGATINEPALLVFTPTVIDASCYGYADGEITITITGGVQPYYFNWGNQNEILLNNESETLTGLIAEEYFIRVRDENGCINEQIIIVNQPAPFISTYVVTDVLCNGGVDGSVDVTIVGGTIPYSTVWSDGQTTEDAINLVTGDYGYEITDGQGCIIRDSVTVEEPSLVQISYDLIEVSCVDQSDASIFVTPWGGTMPYTYLWTTGSDEQNAESLPPGMYDITITDDNNCINTFSFEVNFNYDECLIIPNTFTPNGDNYNDTWVLGNLDLYPNAQVKVFNKWGNEIFTSNGLYEPWDGTQYSNPLPSEVYYYIIVLGNVDDNQYTGTVTIIR
ncbi:MAG: gliding motility-associated C-terminal domain-containing protein [Crocinitomicaceae bacterium]|nr:gliding motility-associated C-terminal domain-containing protein [Crocinitomicaceae bacterium]